MKEALKDCIYPRIAGLGATLTPRAYASGLEMASHLRQLFNLLEITCVFDVGANKGQFRNFLRRRCGYTGWIFSFEPARETFAVLKIKAGHDPRWNVFNYAVGEDDQEKLFNVMQDTEFSSFREPQVADICKSDMKNIVDHQETVSMRRLDRLIPRLANEANLTRIYLKIDTQGYDLEVMKGLGVEANRVIALQSEISVKHIYKQTPDYCESIEKLALYGFEPTGFFAVNRDELLRVVEFDCVAVNTKLVQSFKNGK